MQEKPFEIDLNENLGKYTLAIDSCID